MTKILGSYIVSHWFGKYTGKKIEKLLFVTQKIEKQDLDFKIESSGIFEVDRALFALEHLKQALKNSLAEQWQADKLRQDQISALAHDLKTPLTIIRGKTELLYNTALTDNQKECADYIEGSVVQMQDYVETLINMTKTKENFSFCCQNVKLFSLLQDIHTQAKGLCAVKSIHLEWRENLNREYILADSEQLIRAFANVLSNTIEHTPVGKTVFFDVYEKDSSILCSITDTGNGFSPEALKRATEQFYMDENSILTSRGCEIALILPVNLHLYHYTRQTAVHPYPRFSDFGRCFLYPAHQYSIHDERYPLDKLIHQTL